MTGANPNDAEALALAALAATLTDARRAERFLSLTGLSPDGIRFRVTDRSLLEHGEYNRVVAADTRIVFARLYYVEAQLGGSWTRVIA